MEDKVIKMYRISVLEDEGGDHCGYMPADNAEEALDKYLEECRSMNDVDWGYEPVSEAFDITLMATWRGEDGDEDVLERASRGLTIEPTGDSEPSDD